MFTSAKKKMMDQKMMEMQDQQMRQKDAAMRNQRKKTDPEVLQKYMLAFCQMKDMENSFYLQCAKLCVNLKGESFLDEKERECLSGCNRKVQKFVRIAQELFDKTDDEIKQVIPFYMQQQ